MKNNFIHIIIILALLTALSCEQRPYDLNLPEEPSRLVLLGMLQDGIPFEVTLGVTQQFGLDSIKYFKPDATIVLYENDIVIDTLQYHRLPPGGTENNYTDTRNSYYRSRFNMALVEGNCYHLTANADGYPNIFSENICYMPILSLDSLEANIVFNEALPEENGFLPIRVGVFGAFVKISGLIEQGDELWLNIAGNPLLRYRRPPFFSAIFKSPVPFFYGQNELEWDWVNNDSDSESIFIRDRNYISFEVIRIPAAYVNFLRIISSQTEEIGGLGASNTPVPNNIHNGYGYFTIAERHAKIYQF